MGGQHSTDVLVVENLTKFYGRHRGVEAVSFRVSPGEVVGFLGPNGSGKTTVMRMIMGLIKPTAGRIEVMGEPVSWGDWRHRSQIGYLPGDFGLYEAMTVSGFLAYLAALRGLENDTAFEGLLERFSLDGSAPIGGLSKGNRQKVGLVQALMHEPRLLLLDEPTSGLDPVVQCEFESIVAELRVAGATVLLSSHVMSEIDHLVDRVIMLNRGNLVIDDRLAALKSRMTRRVVFRFPEGVDGDDLGWVEGVRSVVWTGREATCEVEGPVGPLLAAAGALGAETVLATEPSMEEIFLSAARATP